MTKPETPVPGVSTDREIWRARPGDYYSPSMYVTQSGDIIGINVGGMVVVLPIQDWHKLGMEYANRRAQPAPQAVEPDEVAELLNELRRRVWPNDAPKKAADLIERLARERDKAIDALCTLVYRYDCEHEGEKPILAPSAIQTARAIIKRHAARQAKPKENADER
jgi:hypothetical protein